MDCVITGNTVADENTAAGGGIFNQGNLTLTGSTVSDNYADGYGAGIWNDQTGDLTITSSNITGNTCAGTGGGIYDLGTVSASQTTISDNSAGRGGGGGLYTYGTANLADCTISDNTSSSSGGGIHNKSDNGLTITDSTISGNSASNSGGGIDNEAALNVSYTTISGNSATYNGGGISTISSYAVTIDHCTISGNTTPNEGAGIYNNGGYVSVTNSTVSNNTAGEGGGISNSSTLTVSNSTISGNVSNKGGGISNSSTLTVSNSTISGNASTGGGGIYNSAGALFYLNDSTVSGNTSANEANGAGLYNYGGTATVSGSTFVDNTVTGFAYGGGIANWNNGSVTVTNSTIAENSSRGGAGIDSDSGSLVLTDCTIWNNTGAGGRASGVFNNNVDNGATCSINGTLVAGNTSHDLAGGGFSGTYNLIGDGTGGLTGSTNHSGSISLSALGFYGGPTETIVPLPMTGAGNPAIGDGDPSAGLTTDQRGMPRPVSGSYDIGTSQIQGSNSLVVNTLLDGPVGAGQLSLRDAINLANILGDDETIAFASGLTGTGPATIDLNGTGLELDDESGELTVQGPGANRLTIDAGNLSSVFTIDSGSNAEIDGLKITGGNESGISNHGTLYVADSSISGNTGLDGAGIYNVGTATISNCMITDNSADDGGGIYNAGTATVSNSLISDNSAGDGGGIFNYDLLTVTYSTISGNSATSGAGIDSDAKLYLNYSTVSGNVAADNGGGLADYGSYAKLLASTFSNNDAAGSSGLGGGIYLYGGAIIANCTIVQNTAASGGGIGSLDGVFLVDSTISGNTATVTNEGGGIYSKYGGSLYNTIVAGNIHGDLSGSFRGYYNLIGDGSGSLTDPSNISDSDPMLAPLGDYGGPTETMALEAGSPAIGNGLNDREDVAGPNDQRGVLRPTGRGADIGAVQTGPLVVNTTSDDPVGAQYLSLREAIADAVNAANATDRNQAISFASNLTSAAPASIDLLSGPLIIDNTAGTVTVQGPGGYGLSVDGSGSSPVFLVDSGATADIEGLTITGGETTGDGGGIRNDGGNLIVGNSTISGNSASGNGGALANEDGGTLQVFNSTIADNTSSGLGGGIYAQTAVFRLPTRRLPITPR